MTWVPYSATIQNAAGAPVAGAQVTVKVESSGSNTSIASNSGGTAKANPFTTGSDGIATFWARPGVYTVAVAKDGDTTEHDIVLSVPNRVQDSATDTTSASLLTVGAFGIGSDGSQPIGNIDAFTTRAGFYSVYDVTPGTRPGGASTFAGLIVARHATTGLVQIWVNSNGVVLAFRTAISSVWTSWRTIYSTGNAVAAVSQASGVPTGGVMFRGSNSNGQFQMFADGTLICTHVLTSSDSAAVTWTFPSAFAVTPNFFAAQPLADAPRAGSVSNVTTSAMNFGSWNTSDGTRVASSTYLMARGRWF